MPILTNARHELFSQRLAAGWTKADAYRAIAPTATDKNAYESGSRLSRNAKVRARVTELNATVTKMLEKTAADIARVAWSIADDPEAPPSARIAALALESKRYREYSDKQDIEAKVGVMLVRQTRGLRDRRP